MDRFVASHAAIADGDLMLCPAHGVAWQRDMTVTAAYDAGYFGKCRSYEDGAIARAINAARVAMVDGHVGSGTVVLDVGIGSGEFIRRRGNARGFDVNPAAVAWLKERKLWAEDFAAFRAFTFWDVIEHVPEPEGYFARMPRGSFLFASLPIFADLLSIRASRHYRPGEHLYYWTERGFVEWMARHGFVCLERSDAETAAGREAIMSFAFRRETGG